MPYTIEEAMALIRDEGLTMRAAAERLGTKTDSLRARFRRAGLPPLNKGGRPRKPEQPAISRAPLKRGRKPKPVSEPAAPKRPRGRPRKVVASEQG